MNEMKSIALLTVAALGLGLGACGKMQMPPSDLVEVAPTSPALLQGTWAGTLTQLKADGAAAQGRDPLLRTTLAADGKQAFNVAGTAEYEDKEWTVTGKLDLGDDLRVAAQAEEEADYGLRGQLQLKNDTQTVTVYVFGELDKDGKLINNLYNAELEHPELGIIGGTLTRR